MPVIEKRYASALAELCQKTSDMEDTLEQFGDFMGLFLSNSELQFLLLSRGIKNSIKKETLELFAGLDTRIKNLVFLLLDKDRVEILQDVYTEFKRIVDTKNNILHMKITSAVPLETASIERIKSIYMTKYGMKAAAAELVVDKSLLGGIKIQIGDTVIDASLKGRFDELAQLTVANVKK